jgi:hypothetical protein
MIKLSKTQIKVLTTAANRQDGAIHPLPERINGGAVNKVITGLKNRDLITDATGNNDWQINDHGYHAIGQESPTLATIEQSVAEAKPTRKIRTGTKQAKIIEMLKRPEGATIQQMADLAVWLPNTVRGFLAGTVKKKLGLQLTKEKIRVEEPNQTGAKGNRTIYRIESVPA